MYRIELIDSETGQNLGPLRDFLGVKLIRSWGVTRTAAIQAASKTPGRRARDARIIRIGSTGHMTDRGTVKSGERSITRPS